MCVEAATESPFGPMKHMNKIMEQMQKGFFSFCPSETWTPNVNLYETERSYLLCVDLAGVVRRHVYHPAFGGSFSLKDVLPALVPELTYDDLEVNDGGVASALLNRMLLRGDPATPQERAILRADLLAYCKMDTWAMVKLVERLRELGSCPALPLSATPSGGQTERSPA